MKEGWEYKRLGDITEIKGGKRLPKGVKLLATPTNHPYIRVADFNDFGTVDTDDIHYISDSVYEQIKRYIIKKEDIYISIAGTIGKSGIIPDYLDGANLTENACRLILSNNVYQRYIYYFTISPSFIKQIDERTKKSAQPKLALTRLSDVIISYPTIKEQQSIVDYLDSAFAKIDAMKANAEKALNEAKALFQASLKEMLEPKEGWEYKKLGEVCNIDFGTRVVRSRDAGSIYPVYGGGGATFKMDTFNREDCMVISRFGMSEQCTRFVKGKFFLNDSGLTLSMKEKRINQAFMNWQILSLNNIIYSLGRGAAQKNLDTKALSEVMVSYPSNFSEQQTIVATLDSLKSKIDRLQANYEKISKECDALKQAILRQVFE